MDLDPQDQRLIRIENRALVALALTRGLKPSRIVVRRRSVGAGRAPKMRPAFYFTPDVANELNATSGSIVDFLRRYAEALEEYRKLYASAIAETMSR